MAFHSSLPLKIQAQNGIDYLAFLLLFELKVSGH